MKQTNNNKDMSLANEKKVVIVTLGSNELAFLFSSSSTLLLISGDILRASKEQISSFTPRLARKLSMNNRISRLIFFNINIFYIKQ